MSIAFLGRCPSEIGIVDSFLIEFDFNNHVLFPGGSFNYSYFTDWLMPGRWRFFYEQSSPTIYHVRRFDINDSWIVGNYKIGGTGLVNGQISLVPDFTELEADVTSLGEVLAAEISIGSYLIFPDGHTQLIGADGKPIKSKECICSPADVGSDRLEFLVENDLALSQSEWDYRMVPAISHVKIRGEMIT
jgi:hypothetical protein